jgi:hypothetical protein
MGCESLCVLLYTGGVTDFGVLGGTDVEPPPDGLPEGGGDLPPDCPGLTLFAVSFAGGVLGAFFDCWFVWPFVR